MDKSFIDTNTFSLVGWDLCGQSYKHLTLVIYESRGIFKSGTTLES